MEYIGPLGWRIHGYLLNVEKLLCNIQPQPGFRTNYFAPAVWFHRWKGGVPCSYQGKLGGARSEPGELDCGARVVIAFASMLEPRSRVYTGGNFSISTLELPSYLWLSLVNFPSRDRALVPFHDRPDPLIYDPLATDSAYNSFVSVDRRLTRCAVPAAPTSNTSAYFHVDT